MNCDFGRGPVMSLNLQYARVPSPISPSNCYIPTAHSVHPPACASVQVSV